MKALDSKRLYEERGEGSHGDEGGRESGEVRDRSGNATCSI